MKTTHTCPDEMTNLIRNIMLLIVLVNNNVQIRLDDFKNKSLSQLSAVFVPSR